MNTYDICIMLAGIGKHCVAYENAVYDNHSANIMVYNSNMINIMYMIYIIISDEQDGFDIYLDDRLLYNNDADALDFT